MTAEQQSVRAEYYKAGETWAKDQERARQRSVRTAWIVAAAAAVIASLEAIALVALTPLKTVEPYTLLVDRQTGYVEQLKPVDRQLVSADAVMTRSMLAQYVLAREGFDIDTLRSDYRKVALWTEGSERNRYIASMQASSPLSPLATLPRRTIIQAQIKSISSLDANTSLVRFATVRADPGGRVSVPQSWAAVVRYRFTTAAMSEADRLDNPLGFQVERYRRNAETLFASQELVTPPRENRPLPLQQQRAAGAVEP
jgi:type IV secretion system protein VirB8